MRVVIDLDGTICPLKTENQSYSELMPLKGAVEKLWDLKNEGYYIIIQTARNMGTQNGNVGKVVQNIGKVTLDWLAEHNIPFDEIYFGKPNANIYIDDRAFRFEAWELINPELLNKYSREK